MNNRTLLEIKNLQKDFVLARRNLFGKPQIVRALEEINLEIQEGETIGIVGESGSGKSTLGRAIVALEKFNQGAIVFESQDISKLKNKVLRKSRPKFQMIFQDPYSSLNPRKSVGKILEAPLKIQKIGKSERKKIILDLLSKVGLDENAYDKYPHEFSGGQRQRIVIARALALKPKLIVADEPVSALDVSIQAQVLNLLMQMRKDFGLTLIFISHDLGVVRHISDRIAVIYLGNIVELAPADELFESPKHPYTKALLSSIPRINTGKEDNNSQRIILSGEIPNPINRPSGCSFHTRCPIAKDICKVEKPLLRVINQESSNQSEVACHLIQQKGIL